MRDKNPKPTFTSAFGSRKRRERRRFGWGRQSFFVLRSSFFVSLMAIPTSLIPTLSFDTISSSASYSSSSFSLQFLNPFKPHCHGIKMYNPTSSGSLAVNSSTREMGSNSDPLNGRYRHARPCIFFSFFLFLCVLVTLSLIIASKLRIRRYGMK